MKRKNKLKGGVASLDERSSTALFRFRELQSYRRIDRFLAKLMLAQWAIIILVVIFVAGRHAPTVPLLPMLAVAAVIVTGILLAYFVPGLPVTRHTMDVQMPNRDGWSATKAIRLREQQSGLHVPIIAMTAHAMAGDAATCLAAGMDAYLSKPMREADLLRVLLAFVSAPALEHEQTQLEEATSDQY